jgi:hypothetical protein
MTGKEFHIGLGEMSINIGKLSVRIYKPNIDAPNAEANPILFSNHSEDRQYSFHEWELMSAKEIADKYIVDIIYNGKSIVKEIFDCMSSRWVFTHENMVGDSLIVGTDHILKVIALLENEEEWKTAIRFRKEEEIKSRYNLTDESLSNFVADAEALRDLFTLTNT